MQHNSLVARYARGNLVLQILVGIVFGILLATVSPSHAESVGLIGSLFVGALKAIAPILVFILVAASIANQKKNQHTYMRPIVVLYLMGTFFAALAAVVLSFLFPTHLTLVTGAEGATPPQGIAEILRTLLFKLVDNPVNALVEANYIGILAWGVGLGLALHHASATTKAVFEDLSHSVSHIVRFIIRLAPFGIFGLVASTFATTGFSALASYAHLLAVLLGAMMIIALVVNPAIVFFKTKQNPYPLVFQCLRESGVTAFFTRSSAANIPVNMALCEKLDLEPFEPAHVRRPLCCHSSFVCRHAVLRLHSQRQCESVQPREWRKPMYPDGCGLSRVLQRLPRNAKRMWRTPWLFRQHDDLRRNEASELGVHRKQHLFDSRLRP